MPPNPPVQENESEVRALCYIWPTTDPNHPDSGSDSDGDTNDDTYKPKNPPATTSTGDSEAGAFTDGNSTSGTGKHAKQAANLEKGKKPKKKKAKVSNLIDTDDSITDETAVRWSRPPFMSPIPMLQ